MDSRWVLDQMTDTAQWLVTKIQKHRSRGETDQAEHWFCVLANELDMKHLTKLYSTDDEGDM